MIYDLDVMNEAELRQFIDEHTAINGAKCSCGKYQTAYAHGIGHNCGNVTQRLTTPAMKMLVAFAHARLDGRKEFAETLYRRLPARVRWRDKRFAPEICALPGRALRKRPRKVVIDFSALSKQEK